MALCFFVATFEFVRKRRLREEYAILWLLTALSVAILSFWPGMIEAFEQDHRILLPDMRRFYCLYICDSRPHALLRCNLQNEGHQ